MGRHAGAADERVLCLFDGQRSELEVTTDGRTVVLLLPDDHTVRLTLKHYDRLKHKLIVAGNDASWFDQK